MLFHSVSDLRKQIETASDPQIEGMLFKQNLEDKSLMRGEVFWETREREVKEMRETNFISLM